MALVLDGDGVARPVSSSPYTALRETLSLVQRQVDDLRWDSVSTDPDSTDDPYGERVDTIKRARLAVKRSPLVKVAVNLLQHYTLGQGVSVKAQNRALVAKIVDEFMDRPSNQAVITTHQAQKEFLESLYADGDYFFVLFPDYAEGTCEVSTIDATLVEEPVADKDNAKLIRWYKVRKPKKEYDFKTGAWDLNVGAGDDFVYYRHFQNEDPESFGREAGLPAPAGMGGKLQPGLILQVSVDKRGKFGRSQVAIALDWLRAHREFMEDRATINRAAAAVAWKKKRNGPASDIAAEAQRLQSTLATNPQRYEQNPPKASGSTIIENAGTTLEWVKTETGGHAADFDERKLRMMAGAALGGIPNHYFGDEGNANLATATAMELPLLKMYEDYQQTVNETLGTILTFALWAAHKAGRIGENDLTKRYTDIETTPQAVMEPPPPVNVPGLPTAKPVGAREAFGAPVKMPYQPAPAQSGIRMMPKPDAAGDISNPSTEDSPTKPISWYIDIDFPPIVQKTLDTYMQALTSFAAMLPDATIESKKLIVELGLSAFGVNNIDEEMERIFPADMVAVLQPPPAAMPGQPDGPPLPYEPKPTAPPPKPVTAKEADDDVEVVESIASRRRLRLVRAADDAAAALAEVG